MGAGILLLFKNAVVLFRDRRTARYSDAGGAHEPNESLEQCASRELYEESAGLFDIDLTNPRLVKYHVSLSAGYTAFIVPIDFHSTKTTTECIEHQANIQAAYMDNIRILAGVPNISYCMQETDDIQFIGIQDMLDRGVMVNNSRHASLIGLNPRQLVSTPTLPIHVASQTQTSSSPNPECRLSKRTACILQRAYTKGLLTRHLRPNILHMKECPAAGIPGAPTLHVLSLTGKM